MARKPTSAAVPKLGRGVSGDHRLPDDEYAALLAAQDGHCALCPSTPKSRRLHTDRDRATGEVRGLLCMRCNRALPEWVTERWLYRAAAYLGPKPQLARYS